LKKPFPCWLATTTSSASALTTIFALCVTNMICLFFFFCFK
jgi:hypothetical protein